MKSAPPRILCLLTWTRSLYHDERYSELRGRIHPRNIMIEKERPFLKVFQFHLDGLDKLFLTRKEQRIDKAVKQMSTTDASKCKERVRLGDETAGGFLCASLYVLEFL